MITDVKDLFKGYLIAPFQDNFTKDTVSIEIVNDLDLSKSENGDLRFRQTNYIAYLRKKLKQNQNFDDTLEKVIDDIFDKLKLTNIDLEFTPAYVAEKNELHILFNISDFYQLS